MQITKGRAIARKEIFWTQIQKYDSGPQIARMIIMNNSFLLTEKRVILYELKKEKK